MAILLLCVAVIESLPSLLRTIKRSKRKWKAWKMNDMPVFSIYILLFLFGLILTANPNSVVGNCSFSLLQNSSTSKVNHDIEFDTSATSNVEVCWQAQRDTKLHLKKQTTYFCGKTRSQTDNPHWPTNPISIALITKQLSESILYKQYASHLSPTRPLMSGQSHSQYFRAGNSGW